MNRKYNNLKSENSSRDFWDIKQTNICIIVFPEKREKGSTEHIDHIIDKNISNLGKEEEILAQEAQSLKQHQLKEEHC